jgi:hypothetical protein
VDRRTQVGIGTAHRPVGQEKLDTATADSIEFWTIASPGMRVAGGSGSGCHDPCPQLPSALVPPRRRCLAPSTGAHGILIPWARIRWLNGMTEVKSIDAGARDAWPLPLGRRRAPCDATCIKGLYHIVPRRMLAGSWQRARFSTLALTRTAFVCLFPASSFPLPPSPQSVTSWQLDDAGVCSKL